MTSYSGPKIGSTAGEDQPTRCSQVQAISIVLVVTTIILVVGVTVPVVFYYFLVGQVCIVYQ